MKRREFIRTTACAGSLAALNLYNMAVPDSADALVSSDGLGIEAGLYYLEEGKERNRMPAVRPEILANPRAVFVIETHVDAERDADGFFTEAVPQLREEGRRVARNLFVRGGDRGGSTLIKPNFTYVPEHYHNRTNGVYSSPDFITGLVDHLRDIGNTNVACGERMPNGARNHRLGGVYEALDPAEIMMIEGNYARFDHHGKDDLNWSQTRDSLIWKNIPHIRPCGDRDNFLINVATLKVHTTSITTLAVKNLQGCVPTGYGYMCRSFDNLEYGAEEWDIPFGRDFHDDFHENIEAAYVRHLHGGFQRYDHSGAYDHYVAHGGWKTFKDIKDDPEKVREFMGHHAGQLMQEEMWLQRGLDNATVLKPQMNIIEGIIGLDGNQHNLRRIGTDRLCNVVIAGMSAFEVDVVGTYMMGHDPREVWYTRVMKERDLAECDPRLIPIYRITDSGDIEPVRRLRELPRQYLGLNWPEENRPGERLFW